MGRILVCLTCVVFLSPDFAGQDNGPVVFHIGHGLLGCSFAAALYCGIRVSLIQWAAIAAWESSASLCGFAYYFGFDSCSDAMGFNYTMLLCGISLIAIIDYNPQN